MKICFGWGSRFVNSKVCLLWSYRSHFLLTVKNEKKSCFWNEQIAVSKCTPLLCCITSAFSLFWWLFSHLLGCCIRSPPPLSALLLMPECLFLDKPLWLPSILYCWVMTCNHDLAPKKWILGTNGSILQSLLILPMAFGSSQKAEYQFILDSMKITVIHLLFYYRIIITKK